MTQKRILSMFLAVVLLVGCFSAVISTAAPMSETAVYEQGPITKVQSNVVDENADVKILVKVEDDASAFKAADFDLKTAASLAADKLAVLPEKVATVEAKLAQSIEVERTYALLYNGFAFSGKYWMVEEINNIPGFSATVAQEFEVPENEDMMDVTPSMGTSTGSTGATTAWELGYDGEGSLVAIVDTGIRPTHEAFSVMPENGRMTVDSLTETMEAYGDLMHAGSDVAQLYTNEKLPFNYDYTYGDYIPNHTFSDHGSHVAGIAAGNNGVDFYGIAPNAQIVTMQVFTENGSGYWTDILCALEDCVYLGVDVINMSLGSICGFTTPYTSVDGLEECYADLAEAGITIAAAAGNDYSGHYNTAYGSWGALKYYGSSANPDYGVVGSPSTFEGSFSVAATNNAVPGVITAYGVEYGPVSVSGVPGFNLIPAGEYELVYAGLGYPEDYVAAGGAEGKIAIVQRGTSTFTEKCTYAEEAGAVGIILFNNAPGSFNPSVTSNIPLSIMTGELGTQLVESLPDGVHGVATISDEVAGVSFTITDFSSKGTTADLKIKPEISAPGEGITSSIGLGGDADYAAWNGTSMAAPMVAGGLSIIKQYIREQMPDATPAEVNRLSYALAMSTATVAPELVRNQGAGVINVANAVQTTAYLTVNGGRPKLELDDSETGIFEMSFEVINFGDTELTYSVEPLVFTEAIFEPVPESTIAQNATPEQLASIFTISGTAYDVTDMVDITAPETVTVPAGETVTVEITIDASGEFMTDYIELYCPSGMYLEGFIKLIAEDAVNLNLPFLGFVGDWDYTSMLDRGYYWDVAVGNLNLQQLHYTSPYNVVGSAYDMGMGINIYADMTGETFLADRGAISPNGDGLYDAVTFMEFSLLRNPKYIRLVVEDTDGNELAELFRSSDYSWTKDYTYVSGWNFSNSFSTLQFNFDGEGFAENETVNLVLESWLDHEEYDPADNESGRWVIPVTIDTTAPAVTATETGVQILDANYIAYYAVALEPSFNEVLFEKGVFATERGVAETYDIDSDVVYVKAADYAGNEMVYKVNRTTGEVIELALEAFYHGEDIYGYQYLSYDGFTGTIVSDNWGWTTVKTELPGSSYQMLTVEGAYDGTDSYLYAPDYRGGAVIDGVPYVMDSQGNLYTLDLTTFETTLVMPTPYPDANITMSDITYVEETDTIYVLIYDFERVIYDDGQTSGSNVIVASYDRVTGQFTKEFRFSPYSTDQNIVLRHGLAYIGDGQFATVNYWSNEVGDVCIFDLESGDLYSYNCSAAYISGGQSSILYDEELNKIYVYSYLYSMSGIGIARYYSGGVLTLDLTTGENKAAFVSGVPGETIGATFFAPEVVGDINGDGVTDMQDALLALRYALRLIKFTDDELAAANMNNDIIVDATDALLIARLTLND